MDENKLANNAPQAETFAASIAASLAPSTWNDADSTIDCVFYSGATVPRVDWYTGEPYDLVLSLDAAAVRLDRLNNGAPVCDNHNSYGSVRDQLGVVQRAWVEQGTARATLQFSPREDLAALRTDVQAGIIRNVSMGVWIYTKNETTPKGQDRKQFTAIDWEPYEISLTPVPADPGAVLMSAKEVGAAPGPPAAAVRATSPQEKAKMDETNLQAGAGARTDELPAATAPPEIPVALAAVVGLAAPPVHPDVLRAEGAAAERFRAAEIRKVAATGRMSDQFTAGLVDGNVTLADARTRIFEEMAARDAAQPPTHAHNPSVTRDSGDVMRQNMAAALLHRFQPQENPLVDGAGREYMGLNLVELARVCLAAKGDTRTGRTRDEVALAALSTSDFPNILANVANKTLRQGYQAAPRTFAAFCRQVSAKDFKPINRMQLSDLPALQPLNEQGEYHRTAPTDSKQTYSLATFGEVVAITRKTIINDDLDAFSRIPFMLGVAGATLESNTVWNVILNNQVMGEDNAALFVAGHKNLNTGAGSALAVTGLAAARAAMRKQVGPKGTILNLTASYLILPTALETAGLQLLSPLNLIGTTTPGAIIPEWIRSLTPIVEPRLDGLTTYGATAWYLATTPGLVDTIEFCFLEGQDGIYIETRQGFDVDGFEIKARLDFAAAAIDFRGLQRNNGA